MFQSSWFQSSWFQSSWFQSSWFQSSWFQKSWFQSSWFQSSWFPSSWFPSSWFKNSWFQSCWCQNYDWGYLMLGTLVLEFLVSWSSWFQKGFPIGIPWRGIARNRCFRLGHFIARNWAIIANKKGIKYLRIFARNSAQRNCFSI